MVVNAELSKRNKMSKSLFIWFFVVVVHSLSRSVTSDAKWTRTIHSICLIIIIIIRQVLRKTIHFHRCLLHFVAISKIIMSIITPNRERSFLYNTQAGSIEMLSIWWFFRILTNRRIHLCVVCYKNDDNNNSNNDRGTSKSMRK